MPTKIRSLIHTLKLEFGGGGGGGGGGAGGGGSAGGGGGASSSGGGGISGGSVGGMGGSIGLGSVGSAASNVSAVSGGGSSMNGMVGGGGGGGGGSLSPQEHQVLASHHQAAYQAGHGSHHRLAWLHHACWGGVVDPKDPRRRFTSYCRPFSIIHHQALVQYHTNQVSAEDNSSMRDLHKKAAKYHKNLT